ncbi:hypothetical protein [Terriglobus aquaticus]|uniref:Uncharacterized protein n=1 Tax=Terriglobus aquaticus TaxID=940139 RepID=A0ABW9KGS3_9BACT
MLANVLYEHVDVLNRLHPGSAKAERAHQLINDLRGHSVAAGAEDPFPYMGYEPAFADTPVPAWPDARFLQFEDMEAKA